MLGVFSERSCKLIAVKSCNCYVINKVRACLGGLGLPNADALVHKTMPHQLQRRLQYDARCANTAEYSEWISSAHLVHSQCGLALR